MQLMFIAMPVSGSSRWCCTGRCRRIEAEATSHKPLGQSSGLLRARRAVRHGFFGTGFLVQSLLALWLYQRFQISVTAAATILFWSGICSASLT